MLTLCVVCSDATVNFNEYTHVVGVDKGAYFCAQQHITMDEAIGDFDSITPVQLEVVKKYSNHVEVLQPIKDESDLEAALNRWHDKAQQIDVYGALFGRLDHQYVNLMLAIKYPNVRLINEQNIVMSISEDNMIESEGFTYFSLFALEDSEISIDQAKYSLQKQKLTTKDIFTLSNEFVANKKAIVHVHHGKLLLIKSKDK